MRAPRKHRHAARAMLLLLAVAVGGAAAFWTWKRRLAPSGGFWFSERVELPVPQLRQNDPRWGWEKLGPSGDTLGGEGCAVTSAAMVLSFYGVDTDPERLNRFLASHDGYTPQGWIYWEKAADLLPGIVEKAYEDLPSYFLIDWNLWHNNPVIVRVRMRNGTTHFVVIVGKEGWDYLIRDPGEGAARGVYPLRWLGVPIEALRFYRRLPEPKLPPNVARAGLPAAGRED